MGYWIRVLCRSEERLTVRDITDFVLDGVYFGMTTPEITALPNSDLDSPFEEIQVQYHKRKRPVIITSRLGSFVTLEISELEEFARDAGTSDAIIQRMASTRQIIAFEIDQPNLTENAWAMCDCLEAWIASTLDGIVLAPDDGFYDQKLQLIERCRRIG